MDITKLAKNTFKVGWLAESRSRTSKNDIAIQTVIRDKYEIFQFW